MKTIEFKDDQTRERVLRAFKIALRLAELIRECGDNELRGIEKGLSSSYVEPGPAGSLTRGRIDILPTGRNFYSIDPRKIPTPAAWRVGVESANKLLQKFLELHGRYPESVGEVLWSIDAYKADGEQISRILYLLGVRPVWGSDGVVKGIEVIPLEELGRPRIDVVVRISGIVRDNLPNYISLIDEAIEKVITLDEPLEMNYPKKHYLEFIERLRELNLPNIDVEELARARIWCAPPGAYGAGVNYAVFASAWKNEDDLAKVWIHWGMYAYTRKRYGVPIPHLLTLQLSRVEVVVRNHVSDEHDPTNCCGYFAYQGGFHVTTKVVSGKEPLNLVVDTRDSSRPQIRTLSEELVRIVYAKLLNPRWIEEMKKHGYRGAAELMKKIVHLYGWQATTRAVPDEVWNRIAEKYVLDEGMRKWFMENNPYAFEELTRRLLEAVERGLWKPDLNVLKGIQLARMEVESLLEGEVAGVSVQGGEVSIYTADDVQPWRERAKPAIEALEWIKKLRGDVSVSGQ